MKTLSILFLLIVVTIINFTVNSISDAAKPHPKFANAYSMSGILSVPYPRIQEPFDAYFDLGKQKSRIDYYNGLTKTYQIADDGDYGASYKVAHVTTEDYTNRVECLSLLGTSTTPIGIQSLLPDMSQYVLREENITCGNTRCDVWRFVKNIPTNDVHIFRTMVVTQDGEPFEYRIVDIDLYGYTFFNYTPGLQNDSLFQVDKELECRPLYNATAEDFHTHNPIKELIDKNDTHVHDMFENFKTIYEKQYEHDEAHEMRKQIFKRNVRYIHSTNRAGYPFQLAINEFADMTSEELVSSRGRLHTDKEDDGGILFNREKHLKDAVIPESFDCRTKGSVTPIKDQATCGSCWSFGTTGTLEGAYFRKTGKLVSLSEQALVDCSWGFKNYGCDGGLDYNSYKWIMKHGGIPTNESYGSYISEDGLCQLENVTKIAAIEDYVRIPKRDRDSLKYAISTYGPVSVSIDATILFQFYSKGVFTDIICNREIPSLNHNVLAVGYGDSDGQSYWLLKNSWSAYWGEDGYVRINVQYDCGVTTAATFAFLKDEVEPTTVFPTAYPTISSTQSSTTSPGGAASINSNFLHCWLTIFGIISATSSLYIKRESMTTLYKLYFSCS